MSQKDISNKSNFIPRRDFLGASLLAAGMSRLPRLFEHKMEASEKTSVSPKHPLDPLSSVELEDTVQILTRDQQLDETIRFVSVTLLEPPKDVVREYRPGIPFRRHAFVVLLDRAKQAGYEAEVDLLDRSVTRFTQLPTGIQPRSCWMSLVNVKRQ